MSDTASNKGLWITVATVIGGFVIFAIIIAVAYLPNRGEAIQPGTKTEDERLKILADLRAREVGAANSYGWIDQEKGIVRLPIERAMELTVREYGAAKK